MSGSSSSGNGPALVSMAQQFSGLPMHALIGGPLQAAAQANSMMATTQVDYLLSTCFTTSTAEGGSSSDDKAESYTPVMITMQMSRPVITPATDGGAPTVTQATSSMQLPLMTILPLNALAVDSVDVDFEMEVKSSYSKTNNQSSSTDTSEEGKFKGSAGIGPFSVSISGSISHDSKSSSSQSSHYQKSNSAKYSVSVHAGQLPLPPGVSTIIQAYTNNMGPIQESK